MTGEPQLSAHTHTTTISHSAVSKRYIIIILLPYGEITELTE